MANKKNTTTSIIFAVLAALSGAISCIIDIIVLSTRISDFIGYGFITGIISIIFIVIALGSIRSYRRDDGKSVNRVGGIFFGILSLLTGGIAFFFNLYFWFFLIPGILGISSILIAFYAGYFTNFDNINKFIIIITVILLILGITLGGTVLCDPTEKFSVCW